MFVNCSIFRVACLFEFAHFKYFRNRYVCMFVKWSKRELYEYLEYAPLRFLRNHNEINIVVNLRDCGLYGCRSCSYLLFVKIVSF